MRKSKLTRTIEYWIRQIRRIIILLIGCFIALLLIYALIWFIPILIEAIRNIVG